MKAQRVVVPVTAVESWTVVDADFATVEPAERYLAYLAAIERSPNTVRAYAQSLAMWFEFLGLRNVDWGGAVVEDVSVERAGLTEVRVICSQGCGDADQLAVILPASCSSCGFISDWAAEGVWRIHGCGSGVELMAL